MEAWWEANRVLQLVLQNVLPQAQLMARRRRVAEETRRRRMGPAALKIQVRVQLIGHARNNM